LGNQTQDSAIKDWALDVYESKISEKNVSILDYQFIIRYHF